MRLSELMAALSFSTDLGLGQSMEHVLRSCLIALRLADRLGLDEWQRAETYWVTLLALVCTGESFELAQLFGDDVAFRSGMYHVGPSQLAQMVLVLGQAGRRSRPGSLPTARSPGRSRAGSACLRGWARRCRTPSSAGTGRASRAGSRRRACRCRCG